MPLIASPAKLIPSHYSHENQFAFELHISLLDLFIFLFKFCIMPNALNHDENVPCIRQRLSALRLSFLFTNTKMAELAMDVV